MEAKTILKYLEGSWTITKTVSGIGMGVGTARFATVNNNILQYAEEVKFLINNSSMKGRAIHSYYARDNILYMQFMEQENSYRLDIDCNSAHGIYNCGEDIYKTNLDFSGADNFISTCVISGKKNYEITTAFIRRSQ